LQSILNIFDEECRGIGAEQVLMPEMIDRAAIEKAQRVELGFLDRFGLDPF